MYIEYRKKIYGFDCDVYGHLNNAAYLRVYEEARAEALEVLRIPIKDLLLEGIRIYLTNINISFIKGVQLEDTVTIRTSVSECSRLKSIWKQEIFNSSGELCNEALVEGVFVRNGKPFRISNELLEKFRVD